jgi:hypothetical protein
MRFVAYDNLARECFVETARQGVGASHVSSALGSHDAGVASHGGRWI